MVLSVYHTTHFQCLRAVIFYNSVSPGQTFLVDNCTFINNTAASAGALAIQHHNGTVQRSTFIGNTVRN